MPAPLVEKARAQYPDAVTIVVPPDPALVIHEVVARATRIEAADPDGRPADESPMAVARRALAALTPEQRMRLLTENL